MAGNNAAAITDKSAAEYDDLFFPHDNGDGLLREVAYQGIMAYLPRSVQGLRVTRPTAATIRVRGRDAILKDVNNRSYRTGPFDVTVDLSASGAGGLDEGSEANTIYAAFLVFNGTTLSGVLATAERDSGSTTSTTADKLVDSGGTFQTDNIQVGATVRNTSDATETRVSAVDSETTLSLEDDIFTSGENYAIANEKPELPSGYTFWSCPLTFAINASGDIVDYVQYGNRVDFKARVSIAATLSSTTYALLDISSIVPTVSGAVQDALFGATSTTGVTQVFLSDDGVNAKTIFEAMNSSNAIGSENELYELDSAAPTFVPVVGGNIYYKVDGNNITLYARAYHLNLPLT